ncbi:MAG: phosphoethanolamine--lipid A transferase, partial [Lysobacterales bacterium]
AHANSQIIGKSLLRGVFAPAAAITTTRFTLILAVYLALTANRSMFGLIAKALAPIDAFSAACLAAIAALLVATLWVLFNLIAWRGVTRMACAALVLVALASAYFMDTYGVVVDRSAIQSVFETDTREMSQWVNPAMLLYLALAIPPLWLIATVRLATRSILRELAAKLGSLAILLGVLGGTLLLAYVDLVSISRSHRELRHMVNPISALNAGRSYLRHRNDDRVETIAPLGRDAHKGAGWKATDLPRLVVLVVGESARASSFSLLGYARPTNPQLAKRRVTSFTKVTSCGTATAMSLPCMFSPLGKARFESDERLRQENLLDVLAHAGLPPQWFDNNTGSKRIAARTGEVAMALASGSPSCKGDGCFDEVLIEALERAATAATDSTVVVLHQLGSHGPSYFERYPPKFRRFTPTCDTNQLQRCTRAEILNTYDNTIVYTDHVLDRLIEVLESQRARFDSALLYVSDHGESTGERGMYLHGMPYVMAPEEQTHVPMIAWISDGYAHAHAIDRACLDAQRNRPLSHDHLFHSMLGVLDVDTAVYRSEQDLFAPCRDSRNQ